MFVLGHIGFGRAMARPWRARLPTWPLIAGTLVPDLIDKPLYYLHLSTFISCTRTFGHTGLLVLAVAAFAYLRRSRALAAVALGMATHILLDIAVDVVLYRSESSALIAAAWPLLGSSFMHYDFSSVLDQLQGFTRPEIIVTEILGLLLLIFRI